MSHRPPGRPRVPRCLACPRRRLPLDYLCGKHSTLKVRNQKLFWRQARDWQARLGARAV